MLPATRCVPVKVVKAFGAMLLVIWSGTGCRKPLATSHQAAPKLLFEKLPPAVRELRFPMAEIDLASSLTQTEFRESDPKPPDGLRRYVAPGRKFDGWICQVKYVLRCNEEGGALGDAGSSETYCFALVIPETIGGFQVWIEGSNYDANADRHHIASSSLRQLKEGDWVRVSGTFRGDSRIRLQYLKSTKYLPSGAGAYLSLGHVVVSSLERLGSGDP